MRIGIDARMYGPSFTGIGRYNQELIAHLAELPSSHEFVVFLSSEAFSSFQPPHPRFTKVLADYKHYSLGEQWGFLRALRRAKVDLMHFTHFNAPILYTGPCLVTIHDLTLSFYPGKKMTRWWHRLAYHLVLRSILRKAKRIIAISQNTRKDLEEAMRSMASFIS